MPPSDSWLTSRRFGIVIDAGSSGSRLLIYSWKDFGAVRLEDGPAIYNTLPKIEKGTRDVTQWVKKIEPGISSFAQSPNDVAGYLAPLLEHAYAQIPPSLQSETPLFLYATAGMRLLPTEKQDAILRATCDFLKFHSNFRIEEANHAGPCGSSVRIISGEEEGLFGWIAVNYLMDGFRVSGSGSRPTTYGFLDMGGASTQIAFEPNSEELGNTKNLQSVKLRTIGGQDLHHYVFVTTWLGYGTNKARERYIGSLVSKHSGAVSGEDFVIADPCLPRDLTLVEQSGIDAMGDIQLPKDYRIVGSGSFEACLQQVAPLLNKEAPCPDTSCLFNGIYVPPIDFSASHFIGVSEYWYSTEDLFGLGGAYDFVRYERAASEYCSRDWSDILSQHERSKEQGRLGGDGELNIDGKVVSTGIWDDEVALPRLQMQCFKSAWLVNVLHDGIGLPRIVDIGGNINGNDDEYLEQKAQEMGLGQPLFQSLKSVGDTAISWTLGKMVIEASHEIPPPDEKTSAISIHEDLDGPSNVHVSDKFDEHVDDLVFYKSYSNVNTLFLKLWLYLLLICIVIIVAVPRVRRQVLLLVRMIYAKIMSSTSRTSAEIYNLEEGHYRSGATSSFFPNTFRPSSPIKWLRNTMSRVWYPASPASPRSSSTRISVKQPYRSLSSPTPRYQNGFGRVEQLGSPGLLSRPTSPLGLSRNSSLSSGASQPPAGLSRSQNSSQLNLTTLVPRQALSRGGSNGKGE